MPIIQSEGGTRETTVGTLPSGKITLRQFSNFIELGTGEADALLAHLQREKNRRECDGLKSNLYLGAQHPGVYLADELEHRNLPLGVFASMLAMPMPHVQDVIAGRKDIDTNLALKIGDVLLPRIGCIDGAIGWLYLQSMYDLELARQFSSAVV